MKTQVYRILIPIFLISLLGLMLLLGTIVLIRSGNSVGWLSFLQRSQDTLPQLVSTPTVEPALIVGYVWHDFCASWSESESPLAEVPEGCVPANISGGYLANGVLDVDEPGISGITVNLGIGPCPSVGLTSAVSNKDGVYRFYQLEPGTYCVSIDPIAAQNESILLPGSWTYPVPTGSLSAVTVTVREGENKQDINFGWDYKFLPVVPLPPEPTTTSTPTPIPTDIGCIDRATFVQDVTIPDNTNLQPNQAFEKVWRLRNNGTCLWNTTYNLVFLSGHSMSAPSAIPLAGEVAPGKTVDLKVKMVAPATKGTYRGHWMLSNSTGTLFGLGENGDKPFWVQIIVGPMSAGGPLSWKGEYFNNRRLGGTPELVRFESLIEFNWKDGSPATVISADNFSARWTVKAEFEAATYRFYLSMDDGARLYIDEKLVLDSWKDGLLREVTAEVALARGAHNLRLEYYERTGNARVSLKWEKVSSPLYPDWKAEYWNNRDLSGSPALVRNDKKVEFNWGVKSPAVGILVDNFSTRWTRNVSFEAGTYHFKARADDGIRIFVDGKLIIDEWHVNDGAQTYSGKIILSGGKHKIVVEYYERTGHALIEVWWERVTPNPTTTITPTPTLTITPTPTVTPSETAPISTTTPTPTATPSETVVPSIVIINVRVSASSDDAEECSHGVVELDSSNLELVRANNLDGDTNCVSDQEVGMRFLGLTIPQGATITNAYIEFETDETNNEPTNLTFFAEDIDDAPTFTSVLHNITTRAKTSASVPWNNVPAWNIVDEKHQTPDLSRIIQEVINRPGWVSGNDLVIIVNGAGLRIAKAYDGESAAAPLLHVEYIYTTPVIPAFLEILPRLNPEPEATFYFRDQQGNLEEIKGEMHLDLLSLAGKSITSICEVYGEVASHHNRAFVFHPSNWGRS